MWKLFQSKSYCFFELDQPLSMTDFLDFLTTFSDSCTTSKPPREGSFFLPSKEAKLLWIRVLLRLNELVSLELGIGGRDATDVTLSDNTADDRSSSPPKRTPCFHTSGAQDCCESSPLFRLIRALKRSE